MFFTSFSSILVVDFGLAHYASEPFICIMGLVVQLDEDTGCVPHLRESCSSCCPVSVSTPVSRVGAFEATGFADSWSSTSIPLSSATCGDRILSVSHHRHS